MDVVAIILIVISAAAVLLGLIGLLAMCFLFFYSPKFDREDPKPDRLMGADLPRYVKATDREAARIRSVYPHEAVSVLSDDGLRLCGDLYLNRDRTERTVICVHGYNSTGYNDFSLMAAPILEHGCNCLLIDQRRYGKSEGKMTGFGILERKDLLHWIALVNERFPNGKIVLYGVSMGAATVMQACGLNLPETVVGIVEDCGFTSCRDVFAAVLKNTAHLPAFPLLPVLAGMSKLFLKLDICLDSRSCVAASKIPMLFLHGGADAFVPVEMCKACYDACGGEKRMAVYEGAAHAQSHFLRPEAYERDFFAFIENVM